MIPVWSTACPDWAERLKKGLSIIPDPIYPDEAAHALAIFKQLRIVDAPGSPTFGESCAPWVFDLVAALFGSYDAQTGVRHIKEVFILIPKKNSKSTLAAGIMMTALLLNWRQAAGYTILAPTVEVAANAFNPARDMVRRDDDLDDLCQVQTHIRTITHRVTDTTLKVVAADPNTVSGIKSVGTLIDELWLFGKQCKAEDMLREAIGGLASRPEGFVVYTTTQSNEPPAGVFRQKLQYARDVRDGKIHDPHFLPVIFEHPPEMVESGTNLLMENLAMVNPNLGYSVDEAFLYREYRKAREAGEETFRGFMSKHANVEIGLALRSDRWAGADFWEEQGRCISLDDILRRADVVTVGIDGGGLDDLLGMYVIGRDRETREWLGWGHAWAHETAVVRRKSEASRFQDLVACGDMTIVRRVGDDTAEVAEYVRRIHEADVTLKRACSLLTVKSFSEDERVITGIASTPSPDRDGDILEPEGAEFGSAIPFLWQHDHSRPVGQCTVRRVSEGLEITATLVKPVPDMPSQLAARLDEVWAAIKTGLVRGLSVGFRPHEYTFLDGGGLHFLRWELMEVSAVTVPANAECTIRTIKSYDRPFSAASGNRKPVVKIASSAGAAAQSTTVFHKEKTIMNIGEQIKSFENKRAALAASLEEVMTKAAEEGRTLDVEEEEHYDNTAAEIRQVDAHLKRLRELEAGKAATAQPVKQAGNGNVAAVASAPVIRVEQKLDKGIGFARFAKSLAAAKGVRSEALEVARRQYPDDSRLHHVLKSAVGAGTTTDPQWAGSLSEYQEYAQDFIDYLRPQTIIGRFGQGGIPALRQVPFNIRVHAQVSGGAAGWVGEGKAKPLTKFDFESITFSHAKVSAIAVLTEELIRFSSPAADALVRNALAEAVVARLDTDFVDPKKAAVADVSPASITHDVKGTASTGNPDADAEAAFGQFVAANLQPTGAVWLMSSTNALALSMRKNALGQKEYPDMTLLGGSFQGLPVIVSQYVGDQLVLVNAPDIYLADDGGVAVDMSREASLEMQSEPTGDSTTPSPVELVSMFQTGSVAIRAERWINWRRRRTAAVAVITGVNYGSASGG
ncbi:phage major capsid protein [Escherichia coli]|nr:phage major capsid protein [Escherichia coli]